MCRPLPPVHFKKLSSPVFFQPLPDFKSGLLHLRKGNTRVRVQIKDHPVRRVDFIDSRTPGIYLNNTHRDHFHDPFFILHIDVLIAATFIIPNKWVDIRAQANADVTLVKTIGFYTAWASQQADRAMLNYRSRKGAAETNFATSPFVIWFSAGHSGSFSALRVNGGRKAATILSLR